MKEKFIAKVPDSFIPHPGNLSARTAWTARFNVACWIRLQQQRPCRLSLLLRYVDQEGVSKQLVVDQCSTELGTTLLLSSLTAVPAVGRIIDMGIYLETSDSCPAYAIDELFVQSADKTAAKVPKLISAA